MDPARAPRLERRLRARTLAPERPFRAGQEPALPRRGARAARSRRGLLRGRPQHLVQPLSVGPARLEHQRLRALALHPLAARQGRLPQRALPGRLLLLDERDAPALRRRTGAPRAEPRGGPRRHRARPAQGHARAVGPAHAAGLPRLSRARAAPPRPRAGARVPGAGGLPGREGVPPDLDPVQHQRGPPPHRRGRPGHVDEGTRHPGRAAEHGVGLDPAGHDHAAIRRGTALVDRRLPGPGHVPRDHARRRRQQPHRLERRALRPAAARGPGRARAGEAPPPARRGGVAAARRRTGHPHLPLLDGRAGEALRARHLVERPRHPPARARLDRPRLAAGLRGPRRGRGACTVRSPSRGTMRSASRPCLRSAAPAHPAPGRRP